MLSVLPDVRFPLMAVVVTVLEQFARKATAVLVPGRSKLVARITLVANIRPVIADKDTSTALPHRVRSITAQPVMQTFAPTVPTLEIPLVLR